MAPPSLSVKPKKAVDKPQVTSLHAFTSFLRCWLMLFVHYYHPDLSSSGQPKVFSWPPSWVTALPQSANPLWRGRGWWRKSGREWWSCTDRWSRSRKTNKSRRGLPWPLHDALLFVLYLLYVYFIFLYIFATSAGQQCCIDGFCDKIFTSGCRRTVYKAKKLINSHFYIMHSEFTCIWSFNIHNDYILNSYVLKSMVYLVL